MRTIMLTILFLILCVTAASGMPDSPYYELGTKGYELVLDMRYGEADKIFDEMIRMEPENAVGYLYKSQGFFHRWRYTYLDPDKKTLNQFKSLLFKAKELAKEMPDKDDIETQFIQGSAYGNIGLYYANTNKWVRAFLNGRKGIKYIEKIIKKDPEYSDAYFLLGMYNYYAATLPKVIKSLSFLLGSAEGNREKGIEQLSKASLSGDLKDDARIFLADSVYYEEKDFEKASALLEELTEEYLNNYYLRLILAVSYRELNKYDQSSQILKSSLKSESLKKFPYLHGHTYFALGVIYSRINEYEKAIPVYENAYKIFKNLKGYIPDQHDALSLYEIGYAYEMLGSIDKAHKYYSKIKQNKKSAYKSARERIKNPLTPAQIKLIKGKNYLRYGKYYKAEKILRDLVDTELNKESADNTLKAETYFTLGKLEYHLKKYQNSITSLNKVFTFNNVNKKWIQPWSHFWLARCYSMTGNIEKADKEFDIAYEYDDNRIRSEIDKIRSKKMPLVKSLNDNNAPKW